MIKLLILDIDGVLTKGDKIYDSSGICTNKCFNDKDWTAIKLFKCHGVKVCFLTGDEFNLQIARNRNIDCYINKVNGNVVDKVELLDDILKRYEVTAYDTAYIGDDYYDYNVLLSVKYCFAPEDAPNEVKAISHILNHKSGENLVMRLYEICVIEELITNLNIQDKIKMLFDFDRLEKF